MHWELLTILCAMMAILMTLLGTGIALYFGLRSVMRELKTDIISLKTDITNTEVRLTTEINSMKEDNREMRREFKSDMNTMQTMLWGAVTGKQRPEEYEERQQG